MSLTDLQIRKLKLPKTGQKTYFDDTLPGFGVRVSQGGAKAFVVLLGDRRQRRTIGRHPEMKLADARRMAMGLLANANAEGPAPVPRIAFLEARDRFLAASTARNKASTAAEYKRLLGRHFVFKKLLHEINRRDIMTIVEKLAGTPGEARHAFVAIRTMMNWCHRQGLIETSPIPPIRFKAEARSRILSDKELRIVWKRAVAFGFPYGTIVQLLIITGQRRGEIAGLRRAWIEGGEITYPVGFTKNKREHRLPIGAMAADVLTKAPGDGDFVFASRNGDDRSLSGWSKFKREFDMPLQVAPYTLHDLRRTYSSNMARLGVPLHVTEKLLNHISGSISGVAAVYNRHSYLDEMRKAVEQYEEWLRGILADLLKH